MKVVVVVIVIVAVVVVVVCVVRVKLFPVCVCMTLVDSEGDPFTPSLRLMCGSFGCVCVCAITAIKLICTLRVWPAWLWCGPQPTGTVKLQRCALTNTSKRRAKVPPEEDAR